MQLLVIKIKELDATPEYALLGKKQAQDRFTPGDWKRIRSLTRGRRVLVLIPSNEVVLTSVNIPSKNKKQLLQAVPFSLEDSLAEDIEDLHFSVQQTSDSNSHVAVINRTTLEKYLDTFQSHGITFHFILPEILTQAVHEDSWSLVFDEDTQSVKTRLNDYDGFVCDENMLEMFISEPLEKNPPKTIYTNVGKLTLPESLQNIPLKSIDSGLIDNKSANSALALNLITNFSRQNNKSTINWSMWRPVAITGGLLASVWIGVFFWQNNLLQQQSKQLNQQIEQVFKTSFPKSRIVDAPVQMKTELDKLKASAGQIVDSPLPLIADIGPLLKQYKDMTLTEVRYQENELALIMQSPNLTRLEKFKKDAADKVQLNVDIKSSTTTSNKVEATLIITPLESSTAKESLPAVDPKGNA